MAGPSVMVRVLGDLSGLGNAFKQSGAQAQSAAAKAHGAFSSMLGLLNQSGAGRPPAVGPGHLEHRPLLRPVRQAH